MINLKLKAEIIIQGKKNEDVAKLINMPKYTFSRKLNGHSEFTESEIKLISKVLNKSPVDLFFDSDVAEMAIISA